MSIFMLDVDKREARVLAVVVRPIFTRLILYPQHMNAWSLEFLWKFDVHFFLIFFLSSLHCTHNSRIAKNQQHKMNIFRFDFCLWFSCASTTTNVELVDVLYNIVEFKIRSFLSFFFLFLSKKDLSWRLKVVARLNLTKESMLILAD